MNININEKEYNVKETQIETDVIQYMVTPNKRNCKLCKRVFDSVGTEFICWTDSKGFRRSVYFCREHFKLIHKVLKEIR